MLDWLDSVEILQILMQTSVHMKEYEYECKVKALSGQRFFLEHFVGVWLDLINLIPCWY